MASIGSFFHRFLYVFLLFFHLGCFIFAAREQSSLAKKRRAVSDSQPGSTSTSKSSYLRPRKAISSSWSCIKRVFYSRTVAQTHPAAATPALTSARTSQQSLVSLAPPETHTPGTRPESDISADQLFFPLRNDIFPCPGCGEIFPKPQVLEQHQATKHAVSELADGDPGKNIVRIIFRGGWTERERAPEIRRILKIHNSSKILARFEEYREAVMARAARAGPGRSRDERCVADGNELMRFHCSTFLCDLGLDGGTALCNQQYCSVCGIIRSGFSPKIDGIPTLATSRRAHSAVPEDVERDFAFMGVKRAMLLCRVIAGRVGCDDSDGELLKDDAGGFDSILGRGGGATAITTANARLDEEELLVFNPRALLPCFVIVYTV